VTFRPEVTNVEQNSHKYTVAKAEFHKIHKVYQIYVSDWAKYKKSYQFLQCLVETSCVESDMITKHWKINTTFLTDILTVIYMREIKMHIKINCQ